MPLFPGKSRSAFTHNFKTELGVGKPMKQAFAISYSEAGDKKRAKKKDPLYG